MSKETPLPAVEESAFDIDVLADEDRQQREAEDARIRALGRKQRRTRTQGRALVTLAVTGVVVALWQPWHLLEEGGAPEFGEQRDTRPVTAAPIAHKEFWQADDGSIKYPTALQPWQQTVHGDPKAKEQDAALRTAYVGTEAASSSGVLPSAAAGYTSDPAKARNKDGTLNPYYSFATQEDYQNSALSYLERFVNPIYGDWTEYQYGAKSRAVNIERFADLMTPAYRAALTKNPKSLPIYADWAANDYGMGDKLLTTGPRWIGKVTSSETVWKYDESVGHYSATITANIAYSAWAKDQTVLSKGGTLTMNLVTNYQHPEDSGHRFLVNSASLVVK